ncbi:cytochrome c peroxidase [Rhodobium orientis]|nr:cytochrome c peroxidase [Rhodobium orientis]MBB4301824.1 cytochrome c peroxidase [Rhodobium orientis]
MARRNVPCALSLKLAALAVGVLAMLSGMAVAGPRPGDAAFGLPALAEKSGDTEEQVALGKKLFFDQRLSQGGRMACATCHVPAEGFTERGRARPDGNDGQPLRRNAPTLLNVAWHGPFFHDGRSATLEAQALVPLTEPREFGAPSVGAVVARIAGLADYRGRFEAAFGRPVTAGTLGAALAAYERSLVAAGSPFDRWFFGKDETALSPAAVSGFKLFRGKAECAACHRIGAASALFTDGKFHDTGIAWRNAQTGSAEADRGREEATERIFDRYRIKTPSLRNVALTAPYMHDGSVATLEQVVRFYAGGGVPHKTLSPLIGPIDLSDKEIADLVAFLKSLTSPHAAALAEEKP